VAMTVGPDDQRAAVRTGQAVPAVQLEPVNLSLPPVRDRRRRFQVAQVVHVQALAEIVPEGPGDIECGGGIGNGDHGNLDLVTGSVPLGECQRSFATFFYAETVPKKEKYKQAAGATNAGPPSEPGGPGGSGGGSWRKEMRLVLARMLSCVNFHAWGP